MTVRISQPVFNLRDKLSELTQRVGTVGRQLLAANTPEEAGEILGVGRKNIVQNGEFQIWQRGETVTDIGVDTYITDRWKNWASVAGMTGRLTATKSPDVPSLGGFKSSLRLQVTTAEDPASNEGYALNTRIEANDCYHLRAGSKASKPVVVSFWARVDGAPGYYGVTLQHAGTSTSRFYTKEFFIGPVWKKYVMKVPPQCGVAFTDTATNWGIGLYIGLMAGTSMRMSTNNLERWVSGSSWMTPNQTNLFTSTNNVFFITGIQLEAGTAETEFEHRSYAEELRLCQRYFWGLTNIATGSWNPLTWGHGGSANRIFTNIVCPVPMRATPSIYNKQMNAQDGTTVVSVADRLYPAGGTAPIFEYGGYAEKTHLSLQISASSATDGTGYRVNVTNVGGTAGYIYFVAEF